MMNLIFGKRSVKQVKIPLIEVKQHTIQEDWLVG
jgi:hypothetical protein